MSAHELQCCPFIASHLYFVAVLHSGFINYSIIVKTVFVEESKNGGNLALSKKNILIFQIGNSS